MSSRRSPTIEHKATAPILPYTPFRPAASVIYTTQQPSNVPLTTPSYSETILQQTIPAVDSSVSVPPRPLNCSSPLQSRRRTSSGSMRNASMAYEEVPPTQTPTGRVSKAKKGKRVHACEWPGCGKVFTRAEHQRRHQLNHNTDTSYRCDQPGCGRTFVRADLLARHQERHELGTTPNYGPMSVYPSQSQPILPLTTQSGVMSVPSTPRAYAGPDSIAVNTGTTYTSQDPTSNFEFNSLPSYMPGINAYSYGSEGSHSPASDTFRQLHQGSAPSPRPEIQYDGAASYMPPSAPANTTFSPMSAPYMSNHAAPSNVPPKYLHELDRADHNDVEDQLCSVPGLLRRSGDDGMVRGNCLILYWEYFHPSFPIIHQPTFFSEGWSPLLTSIMGAIGSLYDTRADSSLYSLALQEIVTRLLARHDKITCKSRVVDIQTVFLLEILSKYHARQIDVDTSARFRSLYASLYGDRKLMERSPLSVFEKQLSAPSEESQVHRNGADSNRFWIEQESRRRVFHACAVLDKHQVSLFEQRPTIQKHPGVLQIDTNLIVPLPCTESLWNASPKTEWERQAALSVSDETAETVQSDLAASQSDDEFFRQAIVAAASDMPGNAQQPEGSFNPELLAKASPKSRFNHFVFQMVHNVPIRELLIVSGESWYLDRQIEQKSVYTSAKQKIRAWVSGSAVVESGQEVRSIISAHWSALQVLRELVVKVGARPVFRTTYLLHEDWAVYLATLVCWARGYDFRVSGSLGNAPNPSVSIKASSSAVSRKRKAVESITMDPQKRQAVMTSTNSTAAQPIPCLGTSFQGAAPQDIPQYKQANSPYNAGIFVAPASTVQGLPPQPVLQQNGHHGFIPPLHRRPSGSTAVPSSAASANSDTSTTSAAAVEQMRAYLDATNISRSQFFDGDFSMPDVLGNTKGLLDAVRLHKIGRKGRLTGLMNYASETLERLAMYRPDLF